MLALYRSGRQAQALDAYRRARRTLVDELGIEPSPALQRLEQAILQQDESLARRPPLAAPTGNLAAERLTPHDGDCACGGRAGRRRPPRSSLCSPSAAVRTRSQFDRTPSRSSIRRRTRSSQTWRSESDRDLWTSAGAPSGSQTWTTRPSRGSIRRPERWSARSPCRTCFRATSRPAEERVWVANGPDNAVVRVSPDANEVVDTIGTNRCSGYDAAIAVGGGAVWFVCSIGIAQIDPGSNKAHRFRYLGLAPRAITVRSRRRLGLERRQHRLPDQPANAPGGHAHRRGRPEGPRYRLRRGLGERFRSRRDLAAVSCAGRTVHASVPRASASAMAPSTSLSAPVESGSPTVATAPSRGSIRSRTKSLRRSASGTALKASRSERGRLGERAGARARGPEKVVRKGWTHA